MKPRFALLAGMIFGAAALRLLPHPPNFEPIGALALFAGAQLDNRRWAFIIPLAAMLLSDAVIGFDAQLPLVYAAFVLIVWTGFSLRGRTAVLPVVGASLSASALFFIVTNFGVWLSGELYSRTLEGLITCYVAAIPFFANTVAGGLFYAAVLFGGFAFAERKVPFFAPASRA